MSHYFKQHKNQPENLTEQTACDSAGDAEATFPMPDSSSDIQELCLPVDENRCSELARGTASTNVSQVLMLIHWERAITWTSIIGPKQSPDTNSW